MAKGKRQNRELKPEEERLVRWMLEHGTPEGRSFLGQLNLARVTPWRCPCGCASIEFSVEGYPAPSGGMRLLGDFVFGEGDHLSGIFVCQRGGVLSGVEVYGFQCDAPRSLPEPEALRPFGEAAAGQEAP